MIVLREVEVCGGEVTVMISPGAIKMKVGVVHAAKPGNGFAQTFVIGGSGVCAKRKLWSFGEPSE